MPVEKLDIAALVQDALARFSRNRIGAKPPVSLTLSPTFTPVPWRDHTLREFIRYFLYETLVSSDPDAPIEISLRQRLPLNDLNSFLRLGQTSWTQLRLSGRGLKIDERFVEDLFADCGYRCDEKLGVEGSPACLGIFGAVETPARKLVFCLELKNHRILCDLLIPVEEGAQTLLGLSSPEAKAAD